MNEKKRFLTIRDYAQTNNLNACFIIGGGTSLKDFDLHRLDKEFTLGINHVVESYTPTASIFADKIFLSKTKYDFSNFHGMVFAGEDSNWDSKYTGDRNNLHVFKINRSEPVENPRIGLYHSTCTGLLALNLAIQMNFKKIFLLGYDFYHDNGRVHWHEDYPHHLRYPETKFIKKAKKFVFFHPWYKKIWNCNPKSNLDTFKFKPYDELFK